MLTSHRFIFTTRVVKQNHMIYSDAKTADFSTKAHTHVKSESCVDDREGLRLNSTECTQ